MREAGRMGLVRERPSRPLRVSGMLLLVTVGATAINAGTPVIPWALLWPSAPA